MKNILLNSCYPPTPPAPKKAPSLVSSPFTVCSSACTTVDGELLESPSAAGWPVPPASTQPPDQQVPLLSPLHPGDGHEAPCSDTVARPAPKWVLSCCSSELQMRCGLPGMALAPRLSPLPGGRSALVPTPARQWQESSQHGQGAHPTQPSRRAFMATRAPVATATRHIAGLDLGGWEPGCWGCSG